MLSWVINVIYKIVSLDCIADSSIWLQIPPQGPAQIWRLLGHQNSSLWPPETGRYITAPATSHSVTEWGIVVDLQRLTVVMLDLSRICFRKHNTIFVFSSNAEMVLVVKILPCGRKWPVNPAPISIRWVLMAWRRKDTARVMLYITEYHYHGVTMNSRHKGPVTRKMFSFDDVVMFRFQYQKE